MKKMLYIVVLLETTTFFHTLIFFIMPTTHYVFFDGCTFFVGSLEYDQTEDTEIFFQSSDFNECCEVSDKQNDIAQGMER